MRLNMDQIPLPPGAFRPSGKTDGLGSSDASLSRRAHGKKHRKQPQEHKDWMICHLNDDHQLELRTSQSLSPIASKLQDAIDRVLQAYFRQHRQPNGSIDPQQRQSKQYSGELKELTLHNLADRTPKSCQAGDLAPYAIPATSKRRRVDSRSQHGKLARNSSSSSCNDPGPLDQALQKESKNNPAPVRTPSLREISLSDDESWIEWFSNAFKAIQQQGCRTIAKEWIKLIHPKKQSTHPYNGKSSKDKEANPERTRPPYWPPGIQHKEPDHIDKEARVALLIHLIMGTPQQEITAANADGRSGGREVTAHQFLETLTKKQEDFGDKWSIVLMVIDVRMMLEKYKDGEYDDDTTVAVPEYCESARAASTKKPRLRSQGDTAEELQEVHDGDMESCPVSATTPPSPRDSSLSPCLLDNEHNMATLNTSFSSTTTKASSGQSPPVLRPKPDTLSKQFHDNAQLPGSNHMLLDSSSSPHNMSFHQPIRAPHRQSMIQDHSWPVTTAMNPPLNNNFGTLMGMAHASVANMNPSNLANDMYIPAHHGSMQLGMVVPYSDSQHFAFYGQNTNGDATFRHLHDTSQEICSDSEFALSEHFCPAVYMPAHHTSQQ